VVEWQVDDFSVIDSNGEKSVLIVLVGDSEEIGLFAGQFG